MQGVNAPRLPLPSPAGLQEMPEGEMERLLDEVESEKQQRRGPAGSGSGGSGAAQ